MIVEKPFELDDEPRVPPSIRFKLMRILRGAQRVAVSHVDGDGGVKKINGLKFQTKATPHAMPDENMDELATELCRIMHYHWVSKHLDASEEEMQPLTYRIQAFVDNPKRGEPKRPTFDWSYDPNAAGSNLDEIDELEKMAFRGLLDLYERANETNHLHIAEMQDRFLVLAEHMAGPIAQTSELLKYAGGLSLQGTQALVQALEMTRSFEAQKEIEAQKTERSKAMWERVGGWIDFGVQELISQLGPKAKQKFNEAKAKAQATGLMDDDENAPPTQTPPDAHQDQDDEDTGLTEEERANPIALLCRTFGDMMNGQQHRDLDELFTKKEKAIFNAVFCSKTDDEAVECYTQLEKTMSMDKLLRLNKLLSEDQRTIFIRVKALVARARGDEES